MSEPVWVDEAGALAIHDQSLIRFGGAHGTRDVNLLRSALARPRQHFFYADTTDVLELAAILTTGIVRNHPFVDGNKRTGFVAGASFLLVNGYRITASQELVVSTVLALAAGQIDESAYADFLRANSEPATTPTAT